MKLLKNKIRISSIYFHNLLTNALVVLLSIVLLGLSFVSVSYNYSMRNSRKNMEVIEQEAVKVLSAYSGEWDLNGFEVKIILSTLSYTSGYHLMICSPSGQVVSCCDQQMPCEHQGSYISSYILHTMETKGSYTGVTDLGGVYPERRHVVAQALYNTEGEKLVGYILISGNAASMARIWRPFSGIFILFSLIVMIITLIVTVITTRKQTRPIHEMALAAGKFAHGDFSVRVNENTGPDEIRELSDAFNVMADYLERSEKTRRELIGNVSHELKTPMTTITGFADGILDGTIPQEKQMDYIRIISSETKRLSRLVRSMLDISHLQSKRPETLLQGTFNINEVVLSVLVGLEKKINDRNLDVDVQVQDKPVFVRGDADSITQVVYNLADNAVKFAIPGTTLGFRVWKDDAKAHVAVENAGADIPPEELPLIFDRFHKSDKSRSMDKDGVGLGLYIVKTIVNNHNEDIFVTSAEGVTKFEFTLALANNSEKIQK